jgi:hypothetical protein
MSIEFQKLSPNLQRSAAKTLLRQCVQQLCMRLVVEPIYSRPRYCTEPFTESFAAKRRKTPQNYSFLRGKIGSWRGLSPLESAGHFEVRRVQIPSGTPTT